MDYYTLKLDGYPAPKQVLYRVNSGVVEKWIPISKVWKQSALFPTEERLVAGGGVSVEEKELRKSPCFLFALKRQ